MVFKINNNKYARDYKSVIFNSPGLVHIGESSVIDYKSITFNSSGLDVLSAADRRYFHINYASIESIEVHAVTKRLIVNKNGEYTDLAGIKTVVRTAGGEYITIIPEEGVCLNTLYKILDYRKYFKDFKMYIDGPDTFDIPLKIYSKFGVKLPFADDRNNMTQLFLISIMMTGIGIYQIIEGIINGGLFARCMVSCVLFFVSELLVLPMVYKEYLKYTIRKAIGL